MVFMLAVAHSGSSLRAVDCSPSHAPHSHCCNIRQIPTLIQHVYSFNNNRGSLPPGI